jgi:hypothetical protein
MKTISRSQLFAFRARRQFLAPEARGETPEEVYDILRALQPFPPAAGSMPGSPPRPSSRVTGYEDDWSQRWRAKGSLVKGRYLYGNIGYIAREDLALYAAAFRQPMREPMSMPVRRVLDSLSQHGPVLKSTLRDVTSLERDRFNRALIDLTKAFEIMEIQHQIDWNSPWDLYARAYPEADYHVWEQAEARIEVIRRFMRVFGPATVHEIAHWSGWSPKIAGKLLDQMRQDGVTVMVEVEDRADPAFIDRDEIANLESVQPTEPFVVFLPDNDPLVIPQASSVVEQYRRERFPYCHGVVVRDGEIVGAAWGHYKRKIIHIEDLALEADIVHIPPLMDQILTAIESFFGEDHAPITIYGINGSAEAPWTDETLTHNGYVWDKGYYVKK